MKKILEKYVWHIERLLLRAVTNNRELTHNEQKGIAYYTVAAETVKALMAAPTPAWTYLKFEKSVIL